VHSTALRLIPFALARPPCFVSAMPSHAMLRVDRLTKTYRTAAGPLTVLREASFELEAGASIAVVGPSGSGKTTLLGLCAGLDRAT
jgi:putative ABC transport system ATP-binding protein